MRDPICMHCYVSGKVQGVWFRAATKKEADALCLTGWVCNLPDGRVEILACGEKEEINALYEWLKEGPPLAKVEDLFYEELPWQEHAQFIVK